LRRASAPCEEIELVYRTAQVVTGYAMKSEAILEAKRRSRRFLSLDPPRTPAELLTALAAYAGEDREVDLYGKGALVERLETRVATLLGKPAAVFMPSGKTAQLIALRILAERAGCRRIALHPRCHLEEHEAKAYHELYDLRSAALGGPDRLPSADDIDAIGEKLGGAVIEMPLRRLGCLLPSWKDLVAFCERARARAVPLHLDGARIWESQPFYGRSHAEIAALFDTVYVSFYKGLGGLAGAAIAGSADLIAEAKVWQQRAGNRLIHAFPYILSALKGLDERLPLMPAFHEKARSIARTIRGIPGLRVTPDPPHANAMLVLLDGDPAQAMAAALRVSEETGIWLFDQPVDSPIAGTSMFEITVRSGALALSDDEIGGLIARYAATLKAMS
jgi:threonine aldolase